MNHIRFMLNKINDYSLLYEKPEEQECDAATAIAVTAIVRENIVCL